MRAWFRKALDRPAAVSQVNFSEAQLFWIMGQPPNGLAELVMFLNTVKPAASMASEMELNIEFQLGMPTKN